MNLYRVIRHADKAMLSVDPLCVDQRDEGVVQLLSRQTEGVIFAETERCRFGVHIIRLDRIIKLVNLISYRSFQGDNRAFYPQPFLPARIARGALAFGTRASSVFKPLPKTSGPLRSFEPLVISTEGAKAAGTRKTSDSSGFEPRDPRTQ
jgi:hypothetical protein